ncbi:hypothetical protein [Sphingobacterium yanglingense]|uniref:hypothetical protein n=1 Tax=Sphingobacterium yanglingense TaxID=1437280 RepID=UPI0013C34D3C|nr:hypothetical protein [Sphingobacterium yanglingense]
MSSRREIDVVFAFGNVIYLRLPLESYTLAVGLIDHDQLQRDFGQVIEEMTVAFATFDLYGEWRKCFDLVIVQVDVPAIEGLLDNAA